MLSKNRKTVIKLTIASLVMFAFGFALVPLYDVFCDLTGLNGKTGRIDAAQATSAPVDLNRTITVEFVASLNKSTRMEFRPLTTQMDVRPGEIYTMNYYAKNNAPNRIVTQAVPSVTPVRASSHFDKLDCFCFSQQIFNANEEKEMPVQFTIGTGLPADVKIVSLGYTFYDISHSEIGQQALKNQ